jgi:hypothetical protein
MAQAVHRKPAVARGEGDYAGIGGDLPLRAIDGELWQVTPLLRPGKMVSIKWEDVEKAGRVPLNADHRKEILRLVAEMSDWETTGRVPGRVVPRGHPVQRRPKDEMKLAAKQYATLSHGLRSINEGVKNVLEALQEALHDVATQAKTILTMDTPWLKPAYLNGLNDAIARIDKNSKALRISLQPKLDPGPIGYPAFDRFIQGVYPVFSRSRGNPDLHARRRKVYYKNESTAYKKVEKTLFEGEAVDFIIAIVSQLSPWLPKSLFPDEANLRNYIGEKIRKIQRKPRNAT